MLDAVLPSPTRCHPPKKGITLLYIKVFEFCIRLLLGMTRHNCEIDQVELNKVILLEPKA